MKTKIKITALGIILISLLIVPVSCEKNNAEASTYNLGSLLSVLPDGTTSFISSALQSALTETDPLTDSEFASLLKMREEEKLARDVYSVLYAKWNNKVFANISKAENNHLTAVNGLLKYYGSADTLTSEGGVFEDESLQDLYNELVSKGSASLEEAMKTGALIEEMDIYDLVAEAARTENENILMVFDNLKRGSRNHLRAFNRQLVFLNSTYSPVYLTQEEYTTIVTTANEKGNQYKQFGRGAGRRAGQCIYR